MSSTIKCVRIVSGKGQDSGQRGTVTVLLRPKVTAHNPFPRLSTDEARVSPGHTVNKRPHQRSVRTIAPKNPLLEFIIR